jgi:HK97 family phage prohead protease
MTLQHRAAPNFEAVEFRANANGLDTFVGYAAVFDSPSKPIFDPRENSIPFVETIDPTAFARTLKSDRRMTFVVDHNDALHISATNGQLKLGADSRGLITDSPWPRTDYADNVRALHEAGEPLGMSFTFKPTKKGDQWNASRTARRLTDVVLGHVSVLASLVPAYNETTAQFRALAYRMETDVEELDNLFDALKEGRELSDDEKTLLRKLSATVEPDPEPEPDEEPAPAAEEPRADVSDDLDRYKARLAEIAATH